MARVSNRIEILFSVCKMLSFLAATLIVTSNLITRTLCGPLDWAKVEVPWARADRSKQHLVTHHALRELISNIFLLVAVPIDVNLPWLPCKSVVCVHAIDRRSSMRERKKRVDCVEYVVLC